MSVDSQEWWSRINEWMNQQQTKVMHYACWCMSPLGFDVIAFSTIRLPLWRIILKKMARGKVFLFHQLIMMLISSQPKIVKMRVFISPVIIAIKIIIVISLDLIKLMDKCNFFLCIQFECHMTRMFVSNKNIVSSELSIAIICCQPSSESHTNSIIAHGHQVMNAFK